MNMEPQINQTIKSKKPAHLQGGALIVEILVAFGLASILIPVIILGFISGVNGKFQQEQRLKAAAYLREGEEAARSARDQDWLAFAVNGIYHPVVTAGNWTLQPGGETIGTDFTRSIEISDTTPSDPSQKLITVTLGWGNIIPISISSTFVLTRWKNQTGELTVSGTLINQGRGDWCTPALTMAELDLPKSGVANAISAIEGQIAAGTGDNASGISYANVTVTDPQAPDMPVAGIEGTFDGFKTNDVFTEQNFAYLATDNNFKEVVIIDLENLVGGKYAEAGYFDAPGNGNSTSVVTLGNVGYMVGGSKMYNFDLSSKSGSRPKIDNGGLNLPGVATKILIFNQRAYITTSSTTSQLVIVDISDSSDLKIVKEIALDAAGGKNLYINSTGTRAYVVTSSSSSKKEMFIVNIDETSGSFGGTTGSYDTGGMDPKGIVLVNIPRAIIVGTGGEEYQVIDVTNENSLTKCGGLNIDSGVNGIATVYTDAQRAYSYIITGDATSELKIIEGGAGAGGSGAGLTIESSSLDAGRFVTFNRMNVLSVTPPTGVTVTYQVAVSTDCSTFNYVGNYTTEGGLIPVSINPGQCFRYKATFNGGEPGMEVSTTVRVNYSP